jgi:hypothetical protein
LTNTAPRASQLEKYEKTINEDKTIGDLQGYVLHKILLSLVEPPDNLIGGAGWQFLELAEAGRKIMKLVGTGRLDADDETIIRKYANLCVDLGKLVKKAAEADKKARIYFFQKPGMEDYTREIDAAMEDLRFDDTLKKRRASALRNEIEKRAAGIDLAGLHLRIYNDLSNKTPYVGAALILKIPAASAEEIVLDVSIQGEQYRRVMSFDGFSFAGRKKGKDANSIKAFVEATDRWQWLFGELSRNGVFSNPRGQRGFFEGLNDISTSQRSSNLLCSFAPKYIYQYTKVAAAGEVPPERVVDAVIADLQYAAHLLRDPDYVKRFEDWSRTQ